MNTLSPQQASKGGVGRLSSPPVSPLVSHPLLISSEYGDEPHVIGANPLKTDPELKQRLAELPDICTRSDFTRWRNSFLTRYEFFLAQSGTGQAEPAYHAFCNVSKKLSTLTETVQQDLQVTTSTEEINSAGEREYNVKVSTRRRLVEWNKQLQQTSTALTTLTPATLELEKQYGYTKFQLGALLVRNGFAEYNQLASCEEACEHVQNTTCLPHIADRQVLESIQEYQTKLAIFCDIMADLGLYQAMLKCHEINQLPEEEEVEIVELVEEEEEEERPETPPPPPPKKEKKKKKKKEEPPSKPFTYTLSFPALKPPSGPFIRYVETGAKTADEVIKGIHPRGTLEAMNSPTRRKGANDSDSEGGEGEGFDQEWNDGTKNTAKESFEADLKTKKEREEAAYQPVPKMNFKFDYHGGKNTDSWRVKNGKLPPSSNTASHKSKAQSSMRQQQQQDENDSDDSTTSYDQEEEDAESVASSSSEED